MKITFISTVYNEEKTISFLLDSLLKQSQLPDEVIIVDASSRDRTIRIIKTYRKKFGKVKLFIYSKKGNRSVGRNFAIGKARGEIIVATDAGCTLDKNWVKNIATPFNNSKIDVVAGFYIPVTHNIFEKCLSTYTCVMKDRVTDDYLPSSRSVAFRKEAWKKVGGYPENLDTCEDLVFARSLKRAGLTFKVVKNAFVLWPQRRNIITSSIQLFSYAKGDGKANYIRSNTWFLFARYILGIFLFVVSKPVIGICFLLYILWSIQKNYKYVRDFRAILYLPLLQLVSDVCVILGVIYGSISRFL